MLWQRNPALALVVEVLDDPRAIVMVLEMFGLHGDPDRGRPESADAPAAAMADTRIHEAVAPLLAQPGAESLAGGIAVGIEEECLL